MRISIALIFVAAVAVGVALWPGAGACGQAGETAAASLIYINRCVGGCVVYPGQDDAVARKSSIVNQASTVGEFTYGDAAFDGVVGCLQSVLSRYNVQLTTVDTGSVPRREILFAGTPQQVGMPGGLGGVAPFTGQPIENVLVFVFANSLGGDVDLGCAVAANTLVHVYGLDNEYACHDLTSYVNCGLKSFQDAEEPCGEYAPRQCANGSSTQNSDAMLRAVIGTDDRLLFSNFDSPQPVVY